MVDNVKTAPLRTLTHVLGHDADNKGGRQLITDIVPTNVVLGPGSSVAGRVAGFTGVDGKNVGDTGLSVADLLAALTKAGYITVTSSTDLDAIRTKLAGIPANADVTANALLGLLTKTTPVDADYVGLIDSAAGNALKALSWANIKATIRSYLLGIANQWTAPQLGSVTALPLPSTTSGNIAWDLAVNNDFRVVLDANGILQFPSNAATHVGQKGRIVIVQDATGGRTLGAASGIKVLGSSTWPSILTAANAESYFAYDVIAAGTVAGSLTGVGG